MSMGLHQNKHAPVLLLPVLNVYTSPIGAYVFSLCKPVCPGPLPPPHDPPQTSETISYPLSRFIMGGVTHEKNP